MKLVHVMCRDEMIKSWVQILGARNLNFLGAQVGVI